MTDSDDSEQHVVMEVGGHKATLCENCARPMFGTNDLCNECIGQIPISELEQLADWFKSAQGRNELLREINHYPERGRVQYVNRTAEECAHELQELIAEYGDPDE